MVKLPKLAYGAVMICAPACLWAQVPVGELYSTLAHVRGSVTLAGSGTTVLSGSSIEAGEQPASLVLRRGGNLVICQGTIVAVSASQSGQDLMFSFGSGTIEPSYKLGTAADTIITADFRFVITGPGDFDFDIGVTPKGDTCVKSRRQSTGGIIVNEQMGDGTYQVKPADFVVFHKGSVANAEVNPAGAVCGCPPIPPQREVQVAKAAPTPAPAPVPVAPPPTAPAPAGEHVVAEAPFVFNGDGTPPPPTSRVMRLHVEGGGAFALLHPEVQPPPKPVKQEKKGFWKRLGKALFGG